MGLTSSRGRIVAREPPKFASLYNGWLGYVAAAINFVFCITTFTMLIGSFQTSSTATLLAFFVFDFAMYVVMFWTNSAWYGATYTSRRYWNIAVTECLEVCSNPPTFDKVEERDLKFHNDQWHFSVGQVGYFFGMLFLAIFLGLSGTANPSPDYNSLPVVYNNIAMYTFVIIKCFQLLMLALGGGLLLIMMQTISCFLHSTVIALNQDMGPLRASPEFIQQPGQPRNTVVTLPPPIVPVISTTGLYSNSKLGNGVYI